MPACRFRQDATGIKLKKKVTFGSTITTTEYMDGFQYKNTALDFFPTAEGYVKVLASGGGTSYNYVFNYTDHLGNIRAKYTQDPNDGMVTLIEENQYYPYGLIHNGYNPDHSVFEVGVGGNVIITPVTPLLGDSYTYKFGGKEQQTEFDINIYDFGARNYDPALGRWMNVDPLADDPEQVDRSPYAFTWNNPINMVDPTGLKPEDIIFTNNDGNEIARILTNDETDTYVSVDTDVNLPSPIEIDARTDDVADAVGINFEWSVTLGGGAHGGTGFVYFMNGEDEGSLFNYDYKGGNVGLGEGVGVSVFASVFNDDLPNSLKNVSTFEGNYNGYEASYGFGGYSYSWSNRKNTSDQIYPGVGGTDDNPWTWKNRSLGRAAGAYQGSPKFQARYFGGESYDFTRINLD
ncbi:RHS repeat-associated core domain-containing protein [Aequorivita sp. KMM 9714]|uniref:RHS repeat-associated core domain-containing protein n=1 Tax=Aequorivita sp. KMM 9714 TaxID=2707173 RepID=UPI0013EA4BF6|nr:RHS repeat-associated core domain-containing protein [Aequorivita sp. KMM 9714]NGX85112.1 hypothetical protein [Aequorivita sp. KMM 9714]